MHGCPSIQGEAGRDEMGRGGGENKWHGDTKGPVSCDRDANHNRPTPTDHLLQPRPFRLYFGFTCCSSKGMAFFFSLRAPGPARFGWVLAFFADQGVDR